MVTIKDVAKMANVAKSTVSNVISGKRFVSPEVQAKVLKACKDLNYTPSFMASSLVTKKTAIIGLFLGIENQYQDFYTDLIKGVMLEAASVGLKTLLYFSVSLEEMASALYLKKSPIDGAILLAPSIGDFRIKHIHQDKIPYVLIGHPSDSVSNTYYVDIDNVTITYEITQHLIKLGHKKILFFNCNSMYTISSDRISGFEQALNAYHIDKNGCKNLYIQNNDDDNEVYDYLKKEFSSNDSYTAIIVPSDIVGEKVYSVLKSLGYTIGKDISVASLGGNTVAQMLEPKLTTMVQNYEEMGKKCVELLNIQLSNQNLDKKSVMADYNILFTDSCCTAKEA